MEKKTKIILTVAVAISMVVVATIFFVVFGFDKQKSFEQSNIDTRRHIDNITIINNCSGDLEGFLNFEVYEDEFYTKEVGASNPAYNVSYNISIKEGKTETYTITVPNNIDNNFSYFHFEITCKDNSTTYSRSGPWVNSELYEIYETGHGIHWKFLGFHM